MLCKNLIPVEPNYGPYYSQLGFSNSFEQLRYMMEERTGVSGNSLRIEEAVYCHIEGKSKAGCPLAKQVIVRLVKITNKRLLISMSVNLNDNSEQGCTEWGHLGHVPQAQHEQGALKWVIEGKEIILF